jgi:hypothetical protein
MNDSEVHEPARRNLPLYPPVGLFDDFYGVFEARLEACYGK